MKIRANIYSVLGLGFLILISSCQRRPEATEEEAGRTPPAETDSRGYDPLELPEDKEVVPEAHPKSGRITGQSGLVEVSDASPDSALATISPEPVEIDSLSGQAFRVQLFTSKVYGEARSATVVAEEIFDRPVFLDYEVPYFKVRVGNFTDREKAEAYLMRVKAAGYPDAWVVAVNIKVKETSSMYDEPLELPLLDSLEQPEKESVIDEQPEN